MTYTKSETSPADIGRDETGEIVERTDDFPCMHQETASYLEEELGALEALAHPTPAEYDRIVELYAIFNNSTLEIM